MNVQIAMLKSNQEVLSAALVASNCQGKTFYNNGENQTGAGDVFCPHCGQKCDANEKFCGSVELLYSMNPFQLEA